jgi:DNA polymerase III sliding clamp (beta) subunit (PCNA family)
MKPILLGHTKPVLDALTKVSLGLPSRQSLPALTLVKLVADSNGVTLTSDCLDASVQVQIDGLTAKDSFSVLLSPRLLRASLRGDEFELALEEGKVLVESNGRSVILTGNVAEFAPVRTAPPTHEVDAKTFLLGIKCGLNCADQQSESPRNGVVWEDGMKAMVGGDGKGVHMCEVDLGLDQTIIIPRFSANLIAGLLSWEEPLKLGLERSTLYVSQGSARAWMQLQDSSIGTLKALFQGETDKTCSVSRESLDNALDSLTPFVGASLGKVRIHVMPSHIVLSASHDGNKSSASVECVLGGKEERFSVLLASLTKVIRFWTADTLTISREPNFIRVQPDDQSGCRAVVLLVREEA